MSRGLGDVYKRQTVTCAFANNGKIRIKSSVNEKMGILFIIVIIWFE